MPKSKKPRKPKWRIQTAKVPSNIIVEDFSMGLHLSTGFKSIPNPSKNAGKINHIKHAN